jgi:hypothetical protein
MKITAAKPNVAVASFNVHTWLEGLIYLNPLGVPNDV